MAGSVKNEFLKAARISTSTGPGAAGVKSFFKDFFITLPAAFGKPSIFLLAALETIL